MLSCEEYERIIRIFLVELNHLCLNASEAELWGLPQLAKELASYRRDLQDPTRDTAQVLYTAFAYVDEYVAADWKKVTTAGYEAYVLSQQGTGSEPDRA